MATYNAIFTLDYLTLIAMVEATRASQVEKLGLEAIKDQLGLEVEPNDFYYEKVS
jgi:hypothetical protein